jgi:tRNA dimethylallyltransferase
VPLSAQQGRRVALPLADALPLALMPSDRARLHAVIAQRFDAMLAAGLVEELAALRRRFDLRPELPAMRAVGYRQAWRFLDGAIDRAAFRESGIAATRQLAKRQITWLRATMATRLDPFDAGAAAAVREVVGRALGA